MAKKTQSAAKTNQTAPYKHPEAKSLMRPEVGTQAQFKKKEEKRVFIALAISFRLILCLCFLKAECLSPIGMYSNLRPFKPVVLAGG